VCCALLTKARASGERPYYFDRRMHTLGNTGVGGVVHAALAPAATRCIDLLAYGGRDVRAEVARAHVRPGDTVVDLCCGTGTSTLPGAVGVDTSGAMLRVARCRRRDATFVMANAESVVAPAAFDVATIFFALHEMPRHARLAVLTNARRLARRVVVCDIASTYTASGAMLRGEPYLLDYLRHIDDDVTIAFADVHNNRSATRATHLKRTVLLPHHVDVVVLDRSDEERQNR
jgi:SAM-dependent methyltransferase